VVFDTQDKKKLIDKFKLHEKDSQKRSSFPQGSFDACWQTPQTVELCEAQRRQSLSRHYRYPGLETLANPKGAPLPPE
jgi:hypothetical protein